MALLSACNNFTQIIALLNRCKIDEKTLQFMSVCIYIRFKIFLN